MMQTSSFPRSEPACAEQPLPGVSPADLLEDVVPADALDVLSDHRAHAVFLCDLFLQPLHQVLVVVPDIGLRADDAWSHARAHPGRTPWLFYIWEGHCRSVLSIKESCPFPPWQLSL